MMGGEGEAVGFNIEKFIIIMDTKKFNKFLN